MKATSVSVIALSTMLAVSSPSNAADLESLLPKETDLVVSLNVRQVLDSPVVKANALDLIRTTLNASVEAQEAIKALGLDPLKDFERVSVGLGLENINNPRALVVLEGKFDSNKIAKLMDELIKKDPKQFAAEKGGGKLIYRITPAKQPIAVYAHPIDAGVIVLGTVKEFVVNAIDGSKGARKSVLRKELTDLLAKADRKASLYVAAHTKGRLGGIAIPDAELKKMLEQVETITGAVHLDKNLQAEIVLTTSNAETAKQVQSLGESAISLYRLQLKLALSDQPELRPLVDFASSIKAVQKDKIVVVTGNLSGDAIEKLLKPEKAKDKK